MALGERLGRTLGEIEALSLEEVRLWRAWFELRQDETRAARRGRG